MSGKNGGKIFIAIVICLIIATAVFMFFAIKNVDVDDGNTEVTIMSTSRGALVN